ncbi:Uxu operon transcriptional regulator [Klebsiella aerogenes]|nr:Uxu operon transcriptional regulator [Klebsiella aerogenes]
MEKAIIPPEKKPYQEIGDDLRAQIAQGRYPVGSRLPPERHIAETYGVSRTIVREALLMLELQGRWIFVRDPGVRHAYSP